ncbi:MAG: PfkB family carbohydrate kinase [Endomicrobia bacterium]|nr:PfkB family carbohydrate kinase [Endomicrobiia bacterium]MCX7716096.1 PfkB family carbohydrate kinase [Endomicrobiia bacterium]
MKLLIVGSIAFDSIKTPFGKVKKAIGGSAVYASIAASYFVKPTILGVVGEDFSKKYFNMLKKHNIDTTYIEVHKGKTFYWKGFYDYDLNTAHTIETQLNVFLKFNPVITPTLSKETKFVFLGNIDPDLQYKVYKQIESPYLVACDTMNYWIDNKLSQLKKLLSVVDILFINETELRQLTKEYNTIKAAKIVKKLGCKIVIVKRGEYGVICFYKNHIFAIPAYPLETVYDPTGAGDSFAGGVMGFLASKLKSPEIKEKLLRQAIIFGTVTASFCVEDFSINKIYNTTFGNLCKRYHEIKKLTHFEEIK